MNWGYKILAFYLSFVALIVFMVFSAFQYNVNLVTKDYYERELQYQDVIDGSFNLKKRGETVYINTLDQEIRILLPTEVEGAELTNLEIWIYNESGQHKDIKINEKSTMLNQFNIPIQKEEHKGDYIAKIKWHEAGTPYYFEKKIKL
jgi:hypothetical protein